ncbi:DUF4286 family protein [Albibacterium bauzanense]|uniref:Uncharacterized protein DUF4286 n=1 Tax=Albibacterium bauzanense TaxID=653929 RepID=A0A4R1LWG1_9SPHI|nr:DUF4286 family protein [Albibacterium bauzanense]TCK82860.1 uncharacterized protein DUF4286 [Albibacterium bauzanense]
MILYNITVIADNDIKDEFREWTIHVFLPSLAKAGLFKSQSLLKVIDSPNEGETFCIQIIANSNKEVTLLQQNHLILLHEKSKDVWLNKIYLFESRMEYLAMY